MHLNPCALPGTSMRITLHSAQLPLLALCWPSPAYLIVLFHQQRTGSVLVLFRINCESQKLYFLSATIIGSQTRTELILCLWKSAIREVLREQVGKES